MFASRFWSLCMRSAVSALEHGGEVCDLGQELLVACFCNDIRFIETLIKSVKCLEPFDEGTHAHKGMIEKKTLTCTDKQCASPNHCVNMGNTSRKPPRLPQPGQTWGEWGLYGYNSNCPRIRTGDLVVHHLKLYIVYRYVRGHDEIHLFQLTYETANIPWPPANPRYTTCARNDVALMRPCFERCSWQTFHAMVYAAIDPLEAMMLNSVRDKHSALDVIIAKDRDLRGRYLRATLMLEEPWSKNMAESWLVHLIDLAMSKKLQLAVVDVEGW